MSRRGECIPQSARGARMRRREPTALRARGATGGRQGRTMAALNGSAGEPAEWAEPGAAVSRCAGRCVLCAAAAQEGAVAVQQTKPER